MIIEIAITIATYIIAYSVIHSFLSIYNRIGRERLRAQCEAWLVSIPFSDKDEELINNNIKLLEEMVPSGSIPNYILSLSNEDRVRFFAELTERAADCFHLDVKGIQFSPSYEIGEFTLGFYDYSRDIISFNLDYLCSNNPEIVMAILGTVFHELRHAQQYRAVTDDEYNYCTQEQVKTWGLNFQEGNYIRPSVDFELYQLQAVENDARAIEASIIQGLS